MSLSSVLSALLIFAVFLGPYSFASDGHALEHETHSSTSHHDEPAKHDHSGVGHALTHCGSATCVPIFVGTKLIADNYATVAFKLRSWFADDALLLPLYLDSDPPVPRSGFSKI
jgi:hypothetical protein